MTRIAVIGYASLDHAMAVGPFLGASGTTLVRRRLSDPWPDHGGFAHVTRELTRRGVAAEAVSWLGPDAAGAAYLDRLARERVGTAGVVVAGSRTPSTYLMYPQDGDTVCVYDPGDCAQETLTAAQREVLVRSDWLVVTVGPRGATHAALDALPGHARVAWTVKPDPDAFPPDLVHRLLDRASVITFGAGEGEFLASVTGAQPPHGCRPDALVVRTGGAGRVRFWSPGGPGELAVPEVSGVDTTGAGDTFVAGLVAALAAGAGPARAVESAVDGATGLLRRRAAAGVAAGTAVGAAGTAAVEGGTAAVEGDTAAVEGDTAAVEGDTAAAPEGTGGAVAVARTSGLDGRAGDGE